MNGQGRFRKWSIIVVVIVAVIAGAGTAWWRLAGSDLPEGFASGNGRLEATEIDIATKYQGRIAEVRVREGDTVEAGEILARMDTKTLEAQLRQAQARVRQAQDARASAAAVVAQRQSELAFAQKQLERSLGLLIKGFMTREQADIDETRKQTAAATLAAARADLTVAESAIEAAAADAERIEAEIDDSTLRAPRHGRVLYRLAEPGEVLPAGGKVITLLDLTDVYMTLFLPETQAGKVALGAEARLVLDAAPQLVIPARVSFVAPRAQFTPKQVETRTEREKMMFRTKVQIDPNLLRQYEPLVKTGVPGVAYVRLDPAAQWPERLMPRLPDERYRQQRGVSPSSEGAE